MEPSLWSLASSLSCLTVDGPLILPVVVPVLQVVYNLIADDSEENIVEEGHLFNNLESLILIVA